MNYATRVIGAAALAIAMSSSVKADDINMDVAGLLVMSLGVTKNCPNYEIVKGGPVKFADSHGADFDKIYPAVSNAMLAVAGGEYDREKLIPEVTQLVRANMLQLGKEVMKLGKTGFCRKYAPVMINTGFMEKK